MPCSRVFSTRVRLGQQPARPALPCGLALAARSAKRLGVRIVRVSHIDETSPAQHFLHLLDRLVDYATRLARLKLVLQFDEGSIGAVESPCQNLRNVEEHDRIWRKQFGRVGDMKLRGLQRTHVRCMWLI